MNQQSDTVKSLKSKPIPNTAELSNSTDIFIFILENFGGSNPSKLAKALKYFSIAVLDDFKDVQFVPVKVEEIEDSESMTKQRAARLLTDNDHDAKELERLIYQLKNDGLEKSVYRHLQTGTFNELSRG